MLKVFLSSTYRDLAEYRSKILEKLNTAFKGVGMEQFIPDGTKSQEVCIGNLKKNDIVIFLISPYYGSLMESCSLKEDCKAMCPMKTGESQISYTHCEYKTTVTEGILHQTYLIEKDWDNIPAAIKKQALEFKKEIGEEYLGFIDIEAPDLIQQICSNLTAKIIEWHRQDKLDFTGFCDREKVFNELIENIDSKVEVWGVGGVGKTALIELALLIQKLKGKRILTIGTSKAYASGSGLEDFRTKCKDDQYEAESRNEITIYDIINAFAEKKILLDAEEVSKLPKEEKIAFLSDIIKNEENFILFIDDFHLANKDVAEVAKSVDHIILSSRKNTYIARKEICLSGIDEEDRGDLIKLFSTEITENIRKSINRIAEGHPVSTELLVKNYQNIDFDKLKNFNLEDADDNQVKDFYKRVIEEIFSTSKQALGLLNDLAILNTDLATNIHRESVLNSYEIDGIRKIFKNLADTGMIKKRSGRENMYEFHFKHIQDYLEDEAEKECHERALLYYERKKEIIKEEYTINDEVEVLYHKVKSKSTPNESLVDSFLKISSSIQPVHYGFNRLINIGDELKNSLKDEDKATVQNNLGLLYSHLGRIEEAKSAITDTLKIYKELVGKNPDAYLPNVAITQNNLGNLYLKLGRFEQAEGAYQAALEIRKELAEKSPDAYLPDFAMTQNNLGNLYADLGRFEEAERALQVALDIYEVLAEKNPDAYLPNFAETQNNLGLLYADLGRFEQAEGTYQAALEIRKGLAEKNPDTYLPNFAETQNNLGLLYADLGRFEEAEGAYQAALDIYKRLAEKSPDAYLPDFAMTQNNLGNLYLKLKRFEQAEGTYQAALDIYKELAEKNPDTYLPNFALTQNNLGLLYADLGRFEEAEGAYQAALNIYKRLAEKNPDAYLPNVAMTQNNLGLLYADLGRFEETEGAYQAALEIRKELAEKSPEAYLPDFADTQSSLGLLYADLGRFEEADRAYQAALDIYKVLAEKNPEAYLPNVTLVWYSKACLESLKNNKEKAIDFLKNAIEFDRSYIDVAKTDEDFDNIRDSKKFKELTGE